MLEEGVSGPVMSKEEGIQYRAFPYYLMEAKGGKLQTGRSRNSSESFRPINRES